MAELATQGPPARRPLPWPVRRPYARAIRRVQRTAADARYLTWKGGEALARVFGRVITWCERQVTIRG